MALVLAMALLAAACGEDERDRRADAGDRDGGTRDARPTDAPGTDASSSDAAMRDAGGDAGRAGDAGAPFPVVRHDVGLNEPFIAQVLQQQGVACPNCPGNAAPRTLEAAQCRIRDLARRGHVGAFREIVPFVLVQPEADPEHPANADRWSRILPIVRTYAELDVVLVLAFDQPLPRWMSPQFDIDGNWCILPHESDADTWTTLKDATSWAIGRLVAALVAGGVPERWVAERLYVEGFNEFDVVFGRVWNAGAGAWECTRTRLEPTPERAASLQGGINFVLDALGVTAQQTSPSVTGTFNGVDGATTRERILQYLERYYAASGGGYPSVHYYTPDLPGMRAALQYVSDGLPATWRGQLVLGETGTPERRGACTEGLPADARAALYRDVATDPGLAAVTHRIVLWRVYDLPGDLGCENTFGVVRADDTRYGAAGDALFAALGGSAGDGSEGCGP